MRLRRRLPRWARRTLQAALALVLLMVVACGAYIDYAAVRHGREVTLPAPTGDYSVGRTTYDWTDRGRTDPLAPHRGVQRALSVWLWYPAVSGAGGRPAPYAPGAWGKLHLPGFVGLGETGFGAVRTHSVVDAPVAKGRFPIVVLEPGMGLAAPQFTTLGENLASHGYLVAAVTPTYSANVTVLHDRAVQSTRKGNPPTFSTADGNRLITTWAADARFAAKRVRGLEDGGRFAEHVIPGRTTYIGHSFGGASSIQACRHDEHCAAAADLDGTPFGRVVGHGPRAPLLILGSENSCVTGTCHPAGAQTQRIRAAARSLLAASTGPTWCFGIDGTKHFNFTDYAAYYLAAPIRSLVPLGTIDGDRGLEIAGAYVVAFLDHTVRGRNEKLLSSEASPYPEVRALHGPC